VIERISRERPTNDMISRSEEHAAAACSLALILLALHSRKLRLAHPHHACPIVPPTAREASPAGRELSEPQQGACRVRSPATPKRRTPIKLKERPSCLDGRGSKPPVTGNVTGSIFPDFNNQTGEGVGFGLVRVTVELSKVTAILDRSSSE